MNESHTHHSNDLILRLSAVAWGLEDESQLNLAKIFRTAAASEIYRGRRDRPRQGQWLEEATQGVLNELSSRNSAPESLRRIMAQAIEAFGGGRFPSLAEVPYPLICCFCGANAELETRREGR